MTARNIVVPLFVVLLGACAGSPIGTNKNPDEFVLAAESWKGAHIREMIAVWNRPNDAHVESAPFSDGYARWKEDTTESDCLKLFPVRQTRVCYDPQGKNCAIVDRNVQNRQACEAEFRHERNMQMHRCIVTAKYDDSGIITEVDVYSRRCPIVFAETLPFLAR